MQFLGFKELIFFVGDALADSSTKKWKYYSAIDGLTEEELQALSLEEVEELESKCMEKMLGKCAMMSQVEFTVNQYLVAIWPLMLLSHQVGNFPYLYV